jgi:hypothetical protein
MQMETYLYLQTTTVPSMPLSDLHTGQTRLRQHQVQTAPSDAVDTSAAYANPRCSATTKTVTAVSTRKRRSATTGKPPNKFHYTIQESFLNYT